MSRYSDVRHDDEVFAARLQEVNREMDTLLHKTSRTRHEMDRTAAEVRMGVPLHFAAYEEGCRGTNARAAACHSLLPDVASDTVGGSSGALRDDLTRAVVSAELHQWVHAHLPRLVAPLVEAQVQHHLQHLRSAVEEVQARQKEVEAGVTEATAQLRVHRRDMQAALSGIQRGVKQDMDECQRRVDGELNTFKEEVQRAKDEVKALQAQTRGEPERMDRRLGNALQHHQQQMHDSFAHLDRELQRWRHSVQRDLEKNALAVQQQQSEVEGHMAQLQGAVASTAEMATHCTAELRHVMEEAVVRASEVRRCRGDVNRLEMLVECTAALPSPSRRVQKDRRRRAGEGSEDTGGENDVPALLSVTHDVAHLGEKLQAVVTRVDSLDRHVRLMDVALARGVAAAARGPLHDTLRDLGDDSVYSRSAASTRRPSNSQLSSLYTARSGAAGRAFASAFGPTHDGVSFVHGGFDSGDNASAGAVPSSTSGGRSTSPHSSGAPPSPSIRLGGTPPRHGEGVPMRAVPSPAELYRPPLSHLSSSSLPFDDDADDPQPMPVVVRDGGAAAKAVPSGAVGITSIRAAGGGGVREGLLPQRRPPPRVIPVESLATAASSSPGGSIGTGEGAGQRATVDTASGFGAKSMTSEPKELHSATSTTESDRSSSTSTVKDTHNQQQEATPSVRGASLSAFSLDRYGNIGAASSSSSGSSAIGDNKKSPTTGADAPASPVDSYISDTPAAAASPEDSYVSSNPGSDKAHAQTSQDRFGRYTPAPASDSEEERDNQAISRSALD